MANRQITRNAFRQIVSTKLDTSKFTDFGVNELDVGLTSFNQNDYNRVLDRLSDELINPLPDLTPRLVSSNFIDRELLISDFNQVNISFFDEGNTSTFINFGIQARLRYFQNVDPFEAFGNLNQVIPGILQSVAGRPVDHAFNPQNFSNTKSAYYESPLAIGSQLFKEGTENEPFEVEYDNSFLLIESFEKSKDTRLKQELDDSFDVFFDRVTTDIQTGGWALIFSPTVRDKFINAYNNIDFSGGILEVDKDGKVKDINKAMLSDSVGTVAGAMMGTTTVTSYVESGAGVKAGGKTGMTSLVIGILFLACIFFAPLATSLPKQIDGAALLFVSVLFVRNITDIEWNDISESAPAILAMIAMPLTYSISNGIALAFVSYALIKIFTGKFSSTSPAIWVIAILSVVSFAVS